MIDTKMNWATTIYLITSPFIAAFALYYWISTGQANMATLLLAFFWFSAAELSITAGYHRLFSHRAYDANAIVKIVFLFFGAAALQGSALCWSLDHRDHHNYVDDNEKDPYSINKGFWWAHIGWLFLKHKTQMVSLDKAGDLKNDKLVMLQDRHWVYIAVFASFILPMLLGAAWGDAFGGLFVAGVLRSVLNHHSTFLINSLSHMVGKQTYSDKHSARDNWFTAILTFGEGYHNYHHEFPSDYRNGVRFYQWDPTKWLIKSLSFIGWTSNLKTIREEIIIRKRLLMREKRMERKLAIAKANAIIAEEQKELKMLTNVKSRVDDAFKELSRLRDEYQELMKNKPDLVHVNFKISTKEMQSKIQRAREDFLGQVKLWNLHRKRVLAYAGV